ncbi:MAG: hypothetical protein IJ908_01990 [Fibrobacter sp.]|nr:hypothetical protein [Fibrobacter sp.]
MRKKFLILKTLQRGLRSFFIIEIMKFVSLLFVFFMATFAHAQEVPAQKVDSTFVSADFDSPVLKDSVAQIQSQYEWNLTKGKSQTFLGKFLFVLGGLSLGFGVTTTVWGMQAYYEDKRCQSCEDGRGSDLLLMLGVSCIIQGVGTIVLGVLSYSIGSKKLERANDYEEQLKHYKEHSMNFRFIPIVNPMEQAFGGNLLLEF